MRRAETFRFVAVAMALLLYSSGAWADCAKPVWKDAASLKEVTSEARTSVYFDYQTRVQDFIVCQRSSLEKRARGLAPPEVTRLILEDRAAEERALAEADNIRGCVSLAKREPDPAVVRRECETYIERFLEERRLPVQAGAKELKTWQRNEHGGTLSFRTLDFGRPGQCHHVECDNLLGVEVTNLTPVVLRCEVTLSIFNQQGDSNQGRQSITLYPGDSIPAARVTSAQSPERVEPEVTCSAARPLASDLGVPASCTLNWSPPFLELPSGFMRSWTSGTALVEFVVPQNHQAPQAIRLVYADPPHVGDAAQAAIEKLRPATNCAGQRFRLRVEYRVFSCYTCFIRPGTVTLTRDDRLLPDWDR